MLLSNHGRVLMCLKRDSTRRMREVAGALELTERAVQRIVAELEAAGYLRRVREGRRNRYEVGPAAAPELQAVSELDEGPALGRLDGVARNLSFID